jgi:hypothetical protein
MNYEPVMVRVWNDNKWPYTEEFNEKTISIAPGKFIEMEMMEAADFMGRFIPIHRDGDGQPIPQKAKMLRMERTSKKFLHSQTDPDLTCQACGFKGKTKKELDQHIDDTHLDIMVDEKEREKRQKEIGNAKGVLP